MIKHNNPCLTLDGLNLNKIFEMRCLPDLLQYLGWADAEFMSIRPIQQRCVFFQNLIADKIHHQSYHDLFIIGIALGYK